MSKHLVAQQRKDEDAALAASHDINVPRIFPTFDEARSFVMNGEGKMIARSEHPTELDGVSGINLSHDVELGDVLRCEEKGGFWASFRTYHELDFEYMCKHEQKRYYFTKGYCKQQGIDLEAYLQQLTFSYWEFITGYNLYVVIDPCVPDRYRMFANWEAASDEKWYEANSYDVFDGTKRITDGRTPHAVLQQIDRVFDMIKQAKTAFGETAFSVIEMQLGYDGELYFLQRCQAPKSKPVVWEFQNDSLQKWEFQLGIDHGYGDVIGSTSEAGVDVEVFMDKGPKVVWLKEEQRLSGVLDCHVWNSVIEQGILEQFSAYIETAAVDTASGVRDPHSSVIPLSKSLLYLNAPEWFERIPADLQAEIDAVWDKRFTPYQPDTIGQFQVIDKSARPEDYGTNPDYKPRLKLNIRSNGREARIKVLKVY